MIVAIHQPNYLPWAGYFHKMACADVFVILDTVQFSKDSYTQRTKIRTKDGWIWLTIPVEKAGHFKPIMDVELPRDNRWADKHLKSLMSNYSKCDFYDGEFLEAYYSLDTNKLVEFNLHGIAYLKDRFGIKTRIVRSSDLDIDRTLRSSDLLLDIIKEVKGDAYLSGTGGKKYLDEALLASNDVKLMYHDYTPFTYKQRWPGFVPFTSSLDVLYNTGNHMPAQKGSL